ncbi:hypothetical protein LCGC14_0387350 [marine sediment metagenome]|uniref:Uncharacterized protein n=1 Tax=marine sediment metagenome TaxID=412755 RepID=A0A0F9W9C5_9ZZZZ
MKPRLLNGCSKSVALVEAFESQGWDAWTCDILPSEGWHKHIQDDVLKHLNDGWDMAIFHTDCTVLSLSGVRWIYEKPGRLEQVKPAADFFNICFNAPIPLIASENPIHHHFAREYIRKYDQIIQPWQFGDMESKAICLWLKGLPPLTPLITIKPDGVKQSTWRESPSPNRKANRSRNFKGVADAMAEQWGSHIEKGQA